MQISHDITSTENNRKTSLSLIQNNHCVLYMRHKILCRKVNKNIFNIHLHCHTLPLDQ